MTNFVQHDTHVEVRHYTDEKRWAILICVDGQWVTMIAPPELKNSGEIEGVAFAFDDSWAEIIDRIALEWLETRIG